MRDDICRAFCGDLEIRKVPAGFAVSTAFATHDEDRIGFYLIEEAGFKTFRIQDDGQTFPYLEASGVDFRSGTRGYALQELLNEYGVEIDDDHSEFFIPGLNEKEVATAALRFVAFSLRMRDFMLMTEFRIASTFREDAKRALISAIDGRAQIEENSPLTSSLSDFPADFVLRAEGRPPVGVFLGTSDVRVLEALFLQMRVTHEVTENVAIVALLERSRSISSKVRQQATNRLSAIAEFRGDEIAAAQRIVVEAVGLQLH